MSSLIFCVTSCVLVDRQELSLELVNHVPFLGTESGESSFSRFFLDDWVDLYPGMPSSEMKV